MTRIRAIGDIGDGGHGDGVVLQQWDSSALQKALHEAIEITPGSGGNPAKTPSFPFAGAKDEAGTKTDQSRFLITNAGCCCHPARGFAPFLLLDAEERGKK